MDDFLIARVIHMASIVLWIGGVAFVTTVAMPAIRRSEIGRASGRERV